MILKVILLVLGTHSFTLNSDVPIYTFIYWISSGPKSHCDSTVKFLPVPSDPPLSLLFKIQGSSHTPFPNLSFPHFCEETLFGSSGHSISRAFQSSLEFILFFLLFLNFSPSGSLFLQPFLLERSPVGKSFPSRLRRPFFWECFTRFLVPHDLLYQIFAGNFCKTYRNSFTLSPSCRHILSS